MVHPSWTREQYPRLQHGWQRGGPLEQQSRDVRYADLAAGQDAHCRGPSTGPPMSIEGALREHCGIKAKRYFLAAVLDDGTAHTFAQDLNKDDVGKFFRLDTFCRVAGGVVDSVDRSHYVDDLDFNAEGECRRRFNERRRPSALDYEGEAIQKSRVKRLKNENDTTVSATRKRPLKIGDPDAVWNFYQQRFRNCQQSACKLIAKAWVKAVEPKKQSNHPYTGKDEKAPDWWPKPWGTTKDEKVRHKEPDHLYKKERVHLLTHILRLVVEPSAKQHPEVQKSCLSVNKLEEVTMEALSSFFADPNNPANIHKRPYLDEIFKVARQEERFLNGEISAETMVYVMSDDKAPDSYPSDGDTGMASRDDEDELKEATPTSSKTSQPLTIVPATNGAMAGQSLFSDLPVRGTGGPGPGLTHQMVHAHAAHAGDLGAGDPQPYVDVGPGGDLAIMTNTHDSDRRPSMMFNSPTEYPNSASASMYSQPWPPTTTAASTSGMYSTFGNPPATAAPSPFGNQASMSLPQGQRYLGQPTFESLSGAAFDPNQSALFRQGGVAQSAVGHHQPFDGLPRSHMP